ncbi:hypothetical protein AVEN_201572-1 [Araneus ventricosus]|uniref:Uncharacterized protein n=1 Tax=Araneus ventricosus TaxID=182803 RepID=A0A4Y2M7R5_ARAVE|nr:hypothetical protein AVEN_201572-1 [Araneus ventricosus]
MNSRVLHLHLITRDRFIVARFVASLDISYDINSGYSEDNGLECLGYIPKDISSCKRSCECQHKFLTFVSSLSMMVMSIGVSHQV